MNTEVRSVAVVLGVVALLGTTGCAGSDSSSDLTTIRLSSPLSESMALYPLLVADELGVLEEGGVALEFVAGGEDVPPVNLVATGQAQIGYAGASDLFFAAASDSDLTVVFDALTRSVEGIVVPEDSSIESIEDLEGAVVGLASDEERSLLLNALEIAEVDPTSVDLVVIGTSGATLATEFARGGIDAFAGSHIDFAAVTAAGVALREITPDELRLLPTGSLVIDPEWGTENTDLLETVLRGYAFGVQMGIDDPDAVREIVRERVPEEWIEEDAGEAFFQLSLLLHEPRDPIGSINHDAWQSAHDRMVSTGELEEDLDVESLLDDSYIAAANDFDLPRSK